MSTEASYWSLDGVIDTLVADLSSRPNLADVQVVDSWPGDDQQQSSCIWIGDATSTESVEGMKAGPINNTEDYTLHVWCDVFLPGKTTTDARNRCTVLAGEVMRYIAESKRINVAEGKSNSARIARWQYRPYVWKDGRGVACRIDVRVTGRR
jgi:hypothetical protein